MCVCVCVCVCVVTDGPFNNLEDARGVGTTKMWGVTLFFMTTQTATCYSWEYWLYSCVCVCVRSKINGDVLCSYIQVHSFNLGYYVQQTVCSDWRSGLLFSDWSTTFIVGRKGDLHSRLTWLGEVSRLACIM